MAKQVTVRADKDHREALEAMQEDGMADSDAEAMRQTSRTELARRGYLNGGTHKTWLQKWLTESSKLLVVTGLIGLAFTFAYPVPARVPAFMVLITGVGFYAVSQLLSDVEPAVTNRIKRLFGGESV